MDQNTRQQRSVPGDGTALRVHVDDGSVIIYRNGALVGSEFVSGSGIRYDALRADSVAHTAPVPMSSVTGIETYAAILRPVPTIAASAVGSVATAFATLVAVLGVSCLLSDCSINGGWSASTGRAR